MELRLVASMFRIFMNIGNTIHLIFVLKVLVVNVG